MSTLQAIAQEHRMRGELLPRQRHNTLAALSTAALTTELDRLRDDRIEYQTAALETPTPCAEMGDPHWCIEAVFVARVPGYVDEAQTLDPYLRSVLKETLDSPAFRDRFELNLRPAAFLRGDEGDAGILDHLENQDGHNRGDLAGLAFWDRNPDYAEIHLSENASALIVLHEAAHLLHDDGGHGQEFRTAFRALVTDRYGPHTGDVFDAAINNPTTCLHGSLRKTTNTETDHQ